MSRKVKAAAIQMRCSNNVGDNIKKDNYSEPQKYEVRISINKGCRDGTYAGHGAGNMQIENLINKNHCSHFLLLR